MFARPHVLPFTLFAILFALWPALAPAAEQPVELNPEQLIAPEVLPQSEFAFHLANALAVRIPQGDDPLRAIRALAALGISPRVGWTPDAAVTPRTIAEVRDAVATAAAAGRLREDPQDAVRAFEVVTAQLGLPLPVEPPRYAGAERGVQLYEGACDARYYDDYYGGAGVPPYTYCRPPPAYFSMYAWIGTPFYWGGYYFPGYYTLRYPYVIVYPPVRPPRFSEGILGGDRRAAPAPSPPPTGEGPGFRDTPIVRGTRPVPRAIPAPVDREPRISEGVLGGQRSVPRTAPSVPPSGSPSMTPPRRPAQSVPRSSPPPPARPAPTPAPAPSPGGDGPGWRDVIPR